MGSEEKILEMLEGIITKIDHLEATQAKQGELLEEIDQRSERTAVLLETEYRDKLQLLFDGHELLKEKLDTLAPRSRVEHLEDDVAMLKDIVKLMRMEISELKKAQ